MKMITFFQGYELDRTEDKIRAFLGSLEGEALDLYLTLDYEKQGDVILMSEFLKI